jgi:cystathionine beta-lyase/cystathionine gamma-synthase
MGIDESLIRVSVGIEDGEDLITDLQQAFAGVDG